MQYYILMPGDSEASLSDANLLGEASFGTFWSGGGLKVLMQVVDKSPELLSQCSIKTDLGKTLTIEQFLTALKDLKIR